MKRDEFQKKRWVPSQLSVSLKKVVLLMYSFLFPIALLRYHIFLNIFTPASPIPPTLKVDTATRRHRETAGTIPAFP